MENEKRFRSEEFLKTLKMDLTRSVDYLVMNLPFTLDSGYDTNEIKQKINDGIYEAIEEQLLVFLRGHKKMTEYMIYSKEVEREIDKKEEETAEKINNYFEDYHKITK